MEQSRMDAIIYIPFATLCSQSVWWCTCRIEFVPSEETNTFPNPWNEMQKIIPVVPFSSIPGFKLLTQHKYITASFSCLKTLSTPPNEKSGLTSSCQRLWNIIDSSYLCESLTTNIKILRQKGGHRHRVQPELIWCFPFLTWRMSHKVHYW